MANKKHITTIILAGGKSSRMGQDKGLLRYHKKPFIQHIMEEARPVSDEIMIVSDNTQYDVFCLKRISDIIKNTGPLGGIYSGLHHSTTDKNLVLSCDIPMINTEILEKLIHRSYECDAEIILTQADGKAMPLIALYRKSCVNKLKDLLLKGERKLQTAINQFRNSTLVLEESLLTATTNINSPEDLRALLKQQH